MTLKRPRTARSALTVSAIPADSQAASSSPATFVKSSTASASSAASGVPPSASGAGSGSGVTGATKR
jgi:hypothetical protein